METKTDGPAPSEPAYDLAVAYRIYPRVSRPVPICSDDKYTLAGVCLKSFRRALKSLRAKIWVLLDGCPPKYERLFLRHFEKCDLEFIRLDGVGNAATFQLQRQILTQQNDAQLVYCAEDDYFYLPDRFDAMLHLLTENDHVHFVTPYDHMDYYTLGLHRHSGPVIGQAPQQWRRVATTCLTFLTTRSVLRETASVFDTYTRRNYDTGIWLSLTKYAMFSPVIMYRALTGARPLWKAVAKAWLYGWRQLMSGKRWNLWAPVPTLATHVENDGLAPSVDWPRIFQKAVEEFRRDEENERIDGSTNRRIDE